MQLRPYRPGDFAVIRTWITDERTHALWCANRMRYPLEREDFEARFKAGDEPFVFAADDGNPAGFYCCALNKETGEALLKFVLVDPACRGRGLGRQMLALAAARAFENAAVSAVHLNVFSANEPALRCYRRAGFAPRSVAENAFSFQGETWDRCNLALRRDDFSSLYK